MKDKFFLFLSLLSLCGLFFIAGAATMHFQPKLLQNLKNAFIGAEGWKYFGQDAPINTASNTKPRKLRPPSAKIEKIEGEFYAGYTLTNVSVSPLVQLFDQDGKNIHNWVTPFSEAFPNPTHIRASKLRVTIETAHAYPNGDLLVQYSGNGETPYGYGLAKFDRNSNLIWSLPENTHHDVYVSPVDGTISTFVQHFQDKPEEGFEFLEYPQLVDTILKISPDGKVLERISLFAAFRNTPFQSIFSKSSQKFTKRAKNFWDVMHSNSIRRLEKDMAPYFPQFEVGDYLVSMRNIKTVAVISHKTKKVIWAECCKWHGQHAARFIEGGQIIILNNYGKKINGVRNSQVLTINLKNKETKVLYTGNTNDQFFTYAWGRLQRLPNGNTLITEAAAGRVMEFNKNGKVVWKYEVVRRNKYKNYRPVPNAVRYSREYFTFLNNKEPEKKAD